MTSLSAKSTTPLHLPFPSLWGVPPACKAPLCCFSCARALISLGGCTHSHATKMTVPPVTVWTWEEPTLRETKQQGSSPGIQVEKLSHGSILPGHSQPLHDSVRSQFHEAPPTSCGTSGRYSAPVLYHRHGTCWCHKFCPGLISDSSGFPPLRPCYVES